MDQILMDSFPASDPPQWDSIAARIRSRARPAPRAGERVEEERTPTA
jgi:hypothetical protein